MKRSPSGQQFVEDDPQAKDIGATVHTMAFATGLLRAHVGGRAGEPCPLSEVLLLERQSEIGDVGLAGGVDEDVGWLDVPVDQTLAVGVMQGFSDRRHQRRRLDVRLPVVPDLLLQVAALDELANDEG